LKLSLVFCAFALLTNNLKRFKVVSNAFFVGRRGIAFCVGAMPAKDKRKSKIKERQEEEHVPAMTIATRGNVKEDNKTIA
jgi:hypothetical protein